MQPETSQSADEETVLALVDGALAIVYDYLNRRTGATTLAEDLTSETFLAAIGEVRQRGLAVWSTPWLIGIARHKLADHWRRLEREQRHLSSIAGELVDVAWDEPIEGGRTDAVMARLSPTQRAALTWRYVDDLPTSEVARLLGRSIAATENLLARSRSAFRDIYKEGEL